MANATTQTQAADAVLTLVSETWEANANGAPLFYDNKGANRPEVPALFGRTVVRHTFGERASLGSAGSGSKVNRRYADVYIQIFVPQESATDTIRTLADNMAFALEDADHTLGVRIRDTQINELGSDGTYWQINVVTSFTYDRIS